MAKRRGKNKGLTEEDRKLWDKVTATVTPKANTERQATLNAEFRAGLESAVRPAGAPADKKSDPSVEQSVMVSAAVPPPIKPIPAPSYTPPRTQRKPVKAPSLANIEKREKSRLSRGVRDIDGRIDLHGMTQRQAYNALLTFIGRAQASGWRTVIVITGKGQDKHGSDLSHATRQSFIDLMEGRAERGVLRKRVPEWLSDPQMRPFVVGFGEAAPNHGGSGALYVKIRSPMRKSSSK